MAFHHTFQLSVILLAGPWSDPLSRPLSGPGPITRLVYLIYRTYRSRSLSGRSISTTIIIRHMIVKQRNLSVPKVRLPRIMALSTLKFQIIMFPCDNLIGFRGSLTTWLPPFRHISKKSNLKNMLSLKIRSRSAQNTVQICVCHPVWSKKFRPASKLLLS